MAKRVRWSDDGTVEVREMRDAETVLAIIHERGKEGPDADAAIAGREP
jgi:hypothetical protein